MNGCSHKLIGIDLSDPIAAKLICLECKYIPTDPQEVCGWFRRINLASKTWIEKHNDLDIIKNDPSWRILQDPPPNPPDIVA